MRALPFVTTIGLLWSGVASQSILTPAELSALDAKAHGDYASALEGFLRVATAARAGDPESEARAEVAVLLARLMSERTGASDIAARLRAMAEASATRNQPELRDQLLQATLAEHARCGDSAATLQTQRELGTLTSFWIAGPFDNERGAAFARTLPAETGFDPDASFDGKRHAIRWRPLPVQEAPRGLIDVGALVEPHEQVACVLATCLITTHDCDVGLWIGNDGGFKVALNGARAGARDARRAFASDQDRIELRLRRGANLLVVTTLVQEGPLRLQARLRMSDGAPASDITVSDRREDLIEAAKSAPREGDVAFAPTALDRMLAAAARGSAGDALRAALFLLLVHPDDPSVRRDRALAEQAMAGLTPPADRVAIAVHAATMFQATATAEERDENPRRAEYERLLALDPTQAETCRNLAELELQATGNATRATELARQALSVTPAFVSARLVLADALTSQHLYGLAEREILAAAVPDGQGHTAPEALHRAQDLLRSESRFSEAEAVAAKSCAVDLDARALSRRAELLLRRGDTEAALSLLQQGVLAFPFENPLRIAIARVLEGQGDLDGAASTVREALSVCPDDDELYVLLSSLAGRRGDVDTQREMLRAALELNPNRKQEARLLEFLEADQVPFHRAYELGSDAVIIASGTPPADAAEANDSHFWILRQRVVRAYRNGTRSTYAHDIVRLLGDRAVKRFNQWYVQHDPQEQRARILALRVIKADGRELRPTLSGAYTRLPPLAVGDTIDVRSRVDDTAPSFFGDYFGLVHTFAPSDGQPCARSELVLLLDPGREYHFQNRNGAPEPESSVDAGGTSVRRYAMTAIPRQKNEDRAPGYRETMPLVRVTTYSDWNAFASWWWDLVKRESGITPAIRAKVGELTAGLDSDADKIRAIYRFVSTDVRYKAWEFGVHGYKPYDVGTIYERRHGDCKDKALLLDAMLGVAGIEAWPVLIRGEDRRDLDDLTLPMVEHFNHCISYLPAQGDRPAMFLDGTATLFPTDTIPDMDQGARVLVVHGPRAELLDIPYVDARRNVDDVEVTIDLAADGSGHAVFVTRPTRNESAPLRSFLANEPARRAETIQRLLSQWFGKVTVRDVNSTDPNDTATPIRLEVTFDGADVAIPQGEELGLRAAPNARPMQEMTSSITRTLPLLLDTPSTEKLLLTYRLPPGFHPVDIPPPVELKEAFGGYSLRWSMEKGALRVERERWLSTPRIEPAEYPAFREFAGRADAADARTVIIRREER